MVNNSIMLIYNLIICANINYFFCRYVCACEGSWRIFKFPIHYRSTSVEKLQFHLPGKQPVFFKGKDNIQAVVQRVLITNTMFLAWFELNKIDPFARTLTYVQIPNFYTYDSTRKRFNRRKKDFLSAELTMLHDFKSILIIFECYLMLLKARPATRILRRLIMFFTLAIKRHVLLVDC